MVKAFIILDDQNQKCIIIIATDMYDMSINNSDIRLIIQWNLPITVDAIIQRL